MAEVDLTLVDVGAEADQVEVVERFGGVGLSEGAGVAVDEAGEVESRILIG